MSAYRLPQKLAADPGQTNGASARASVVLTLGRHPCRDYDLHARPSSGQFVIVLQNHIIRPCAHRHIAIPGDMSRVCARRASWPKAVLATASATSTGPAALHLLAGPGDLT